VGGAITALAERRRDALRMIDIDSKGDRRRARATPGIFIHGAANDDTAGHGFA
jgi:hypothetical protein